MIVVRVMGGLGNQLFQYFSAYAYSKRANSDLFIDNSFFATQKLRGFKLHSFGVSTPTIDAKKLPLFIRIANTRLINKLLRLLKIRRIKIGRWIYYHEAGSNEKQWFWKKMDFKKYHVYLDGYFQRPKYFEDFKAEINDFANNYSFETPSLNCIRIELQKADSVAVHIRRGDFLKAQNNRNPHHYLLTEQYYLDVIDYVKKKNPNSKFYFFSDDIEWVKNNIGDCDNYFFVSVNEKDADVKELILMSNSSTIVTANSTFSWWAAWLNEERKNLIICPKTPYGNNEMIPTDWMRF